MKHSKEWLLALSSGVLLALMIDTNSLLARYSTPLFASWVAHGLGALVAILFIALLQRILRKPAEKREDQPQAPLWSYLGGIAGAMVVALGAIAVNSSLGLSGAISLMLLGQILFGMVSDHFGLFGVVRKRVVPMDYLVVLCVLTGSSILIFSE